MRISRDSCKAAYRCQIPIFELTLSRLGCRAEDCVFIDNSVNNLQVAASLGIKTILFNRDGVTYDGTVVNNFSELESVLKG